METVKAQRIKARTVMIAIFFIVSLLKLFF
jgi:hypothetical protein